MEQESTPAVTTKSVGIRYGLIMALIAIVYFLLLSILSVDMTSGIGRWASTVFYIVIIFMAHKYFKDNGDSFMSYGQGMGITFWIALISSVISSVFTYIYIRFVDTSFIDTLRQQQLEQMEGRGMSDEQIEQAMKFTDAFTSPEAILGFGIVGGIIFFLIIGLIVTIFTQKKSPEPGF